MSILKDIKIRSLELSDYPKIYEYFKKINDEKTFITYQAENITLEYEKKFVENTIKKNEDNVSLYFLAEYKGDIIASCEIGLLPHALNHVGDIGIIVSKKFRGQGIGKKIMKYTIKEAKNKWKKLKIITLSVMSNNIIAQNLYKSLGFIQHGYLPKGVRYRNKFVGSILMHKNLR